jgi:poly(hydroxyalkanoate) depolymerase family esterase
MPQVVSRVSAVLVGVLALALLSQAPAPAAPAGGQDRLGAYGSSQGRLDYQVHVPPSWRPGRAMPVVVALHGCAMTGFGLNSMKDTTQYDDLADREGFLVVYPTQSAFQDPLNCWRPKQDAHQHRGRGEPELITGAVRQVVGEYGADARRVHVVGASSGAGTAVILGVTYPDVYASATSVAGGEYAFPGEDELATTSPVDTARRAFAEMGPRARQVPLMVEQGDQDTTVPPVMARRLVQQWLTLSELVAGRTVDGPVNDTPDAVERVTPDGKHAYTHARHSGATSSTLIESYLVEGQGHAWSGPGRGLFVDNDGPDLAQVTWRFMSGHSL